MWEFICAQFLTGGGLFNWGFESVSEKDNIYAMGCVGIAMVSVGKNVEYLLQNLPNSHIIFSYEEAKQLYESFQSMGKSPVMVMFVDNSNTGLSDTGKLPIVNYDYATLANIDIGNGKKQPCWLHATKGWKTDPKGDVLVSPVESYKPVSGIKAAFIVIENGGRVGLKYDLNFSIPDIDKSNLPTPFLIK